jgi:uncharacterized protein (DUF1778 family)
MTTLMNDRIDVRISREQKELIKFASDLRGFKSLTEFVVFCINKEANMIILENNQILKSIEDKNVFLNAILHPPTPNAKLKKAQLKYDKFIKANGISNTAFRKKTQ